MRKGTVLAVLVAGVSVVLVATSVMAVPPLGVEFTVVTNLPVVGSAPFVATGSAVSLGFFWALGNVTTGPFNWPPPPSGVTMVKYFVCDDGSGTFDLELRVWLDSSTGNTKGIWKVIGGTGHYALLKGSGKLIGTYDAVTSTVTDVYSGKLRKLTPLAP